jgi:UDP-N-acetylmuramate dehydrogenase
MPIPAGFEHIVRENEPLAPYTWFRLGGAAQYFAEPTSVEELAALVRRCHEAGLPVRVLGGGSNLLVRDEGVPGLVVALGAAAFAAIQVAGRKLTAGGGASWDMSSRPPSAKGLAGLETLVGIPGTIGGALHTNAGTLGSDIGQVTQSATVMTAMANWSRAANDAVRLPQQQPRRTGDSRSDVRAGARRRALPDPAVAADVDSEAGRAAAAGSKDWAGFQKLPAV